MSTQAVTLRDVLESDLPTFFEYQKDPEAINMAAFTAKDPHNEAAFKAHWQRIMADDQILIQAILYQWALAGHVVTFVQFGEREISYWLGKSYWGKGIATLALKQFLRMVEQRPLFARAAKDNTASLRVLAKCGFEVVGEDSGFANARGEETEEYVLKLEA